MTSKYLQQIYNHIKAERIKSISQSSRVSSVLYLERQSDRPI